MGKKPHIQTEAEYHKECLNNFVNGGKTMGKRAERRARTRAKIDEYKKSFGDVMQEALDVGMGWKGAIEKLRELAGKEIDNTIPQEREIPVAALREFCFGITKAASLILEVKTALKCDAAEAADAVREAISQPEELAETS